MTEPHDTALPNPEPGADEAPLTLSPEAERLLHEVVTQLSATSPPNVGGIAPVLGSGVAGRLLQQRRAEASEPAEPRVHIDERR